MVYLARLVALVGLIALEGARAKAEEPAPPDFNQHVAPLLAKYCAGCHNGTDKEGELVLQGHAAVLAGGASGAAIVPGKADESKLIRVLTGKDEPAMPPEDNEKPSAEEIAVLIAWINAGAKPSDGPAPDPTTVHTPKIAPTVAVEEAVTSIAYSPDGSLLAVARFDTVELLAMPERSLLLKLGPHRGRINAVRFSADGKRLLAAGGEPGVVGEVRLWDVESGNLAGTVTGHDDSLYAAVLSPDGKLLATSSYDQQIKLWDAASGKELRTLAGHNDAVFDLAFRPDGKILASASGDRTVKLWDLASGERLDTLGQPTKEQYCVAFSPDGKRVAAGGVDNRIRVWQVSPDAKENTNPLLFARFAHEGAVANLDYSADGKTLVSTGEDRTVKVWDAEPMNERLLIAGQSDWAPALAIAADGKSLAVGRLDGSLAYYDVASGEPVPTPPPAKPDLARISTRGVQSGVKTRVTLSGKHLAEATEVKASHEKLVARIVGRPNGKQLEVEIEPAADMPRGRHELWVASAGGESGKLRLYVDELAQVEEKEPNDALAGLEPGPEAAQVWGVLSQKGDLDHFAFDAKVGQNLVFDVSADSLGSKANVVATLYDAQGRVLADNNDFGGSNDPLLAYTIPADGRYVIQLADLMLEGGKEHTYRLSYGVLNVPTGVYPLSVPADKEAEVEVTGYNLPQSLKVKLAAARSGEIEVPLDAAAYRVRRPLKVAVGNLQESLEAEPNDTPQAATAITVPSTTGGRLQANTEGRASDRVSGSLGDSDYFRFESQAGQTWIVETEAARRGSPVDTVIEVLAADGSQIERVLLQAVRDSTVTFRGIDGDTRDCRLTNWEEMQLNQMLYLNGEVVKLFRSPRGPDSGFLFYEGDGGKRLLYYDTSATVHAVDEPCFIVEPRAPGSKLISTGLPVFPIYYRNDDDSLRGLGSDSRLSFTAPADGAYLVRVRDARGYGGDRFAYRLTVRPPAPDFNVSVSGGDNVAAGSGDGFAVRIDRVDGFEGEVHVELAGLPPGFRVSSPLVVQAGHREAKGVIFAEPGAVQPAAEALAQVTVKGTATVDGKPVEKTAKAFEKLKLVDKPKLLVKLEPAEITVAPGTTVSATLKVERNGHEDLVTFEVENLPHGVIVDNIGLNGVLLPKGQTERQVFITADKWVPETTRSCYAVELQAGGQCSAPVVIHVRQPTPLAEAGK